jgi:putative glycosyltransferase
MNAKKSPEGSVPKLSIVATLYRSEDHIAEFCQRCHAIASKLYRDDYEIVLVNDGSPDNSLKFAVEQSAKNDRVRVVDLAKNYGHHRAMMAGLDHAAGELVFLIDTDLEEEPEWLEEFADTMGTDRGPDQVDVVFGVQKARKGGVLERISGAIFYKTFNFVARIKLPKNLVTARLMRRAYVEGLLQHRERDYFIAGLWVLTGFNQVPHIIRKGSKATSAYSLLSRMVLMIDSILTFSMLPLMLVFIFGLLTALVAAAIGVWVLVGYLVSGTAVGGWTSLVLSIWALGGLNMIAIGLTGLYISKILLEVKNRPNNLVRAIYENGRQLR